MKNAVSRLDHINFTVSRFDESVAWYKEVFQFQLVERGEDSEGLPWGILRSGDAMLAISEKPDRKSHPGESYHQTYHFGLRLVDREEWELKMREHKIKTYYSSPVSYPFSTSWYVMDPTGNEIEVAIWKDDEVRFR